MQTQEQADRITYPWNRSIAEHNCVATDAIALAAEMRSETADDTQLQRSLIPYDVYDATVSYASRLEQAGDYLGASILRTNIGVLVDNMDDGR